MSGAQNSRKVIFAAGGVVEKRVGRGVRIAVIHRPRYGGEWNLPKGKVDENETFWDAANREVKEETGCHTAINGFAGISNYVHGKDPKFVIYWKMIAPTGCRFTPSEEVDDMEWLTPQAAQQRLTHPDEAKVVSRLYQSGNAPRRNFMPKNLAASLSVLLYRVFGSPKHDRLANAVSETEIRLRWRLQKGDAPNDHLPLSTAVMDHVAQALKLGPQEADAPAADLAWGAAALESLAQARVALQEFDLDRGWQLLHLAQMLEIWGYDNEELSNHRKILCAESAKLHGWRQKAISQLVCHGNEECQEHNSNARRQELYQAAVVRNELFNTLYHKIITRGRNLKVAFFMLALAMVLLPFLANAGMLWTTPVGWKPIVAIGFMGMLGAAFSVASSLTKSSIDESIPQQLLGSVVTWMRPLIGAASAVVAVQFFQAELLPITIKPSTDPKLVYFVIAFVAGFSERFIVGAIGAILPGEKDA